MKTEIITWHTLEEQYPPDLINIIIIIYLKFNAKKAIRTGYYNKQLNKFYIADMANQYNLLSPFLDKDNQYFTILEWAEIIP